MEDPHCFHLFCHPEHVGFCPQAGPLLEPSWLPQQAQQLGAAQGNFSQKLSQKTCTPVSVVTCLGPKPIPGKRKGISKIGLN